MTVVVGVVSVPLLLEIVIDEFLKSRLREWDPAPEDFLGSQLSIPLGQDFLSIRHSLWTLGSCEVGLKDIFHILVVIWRAVSDRSGINVINASSGIAV